MVGAVVDWFAGCVFEGSAGERNALEELTVLENKTQVMVLVDEPADAEIIEKYVSITHRASPHLFVVSVEPAFCVRLAELPGVAAVTEGAFDADVTGRLDEAEALFAAAFAARGATKRRAGDGLEWDALDGPDVRSSARQHASGRAGDQTDSKEGSNEQ